MNKILFCILLLCSVAVSNAQTDQGDWLAGGNFRLNTSDNVTVIGLTPNAGVFIINNLVFGGALTLVYEKTGDNKRTDFGIGPFLRYYFTKANVRPILHGNIDFISTRNTTPLGRSTETGINYFLGGGAAIFIGEQVSIDGLMGYYHSKLKDFDGSGGFALTVGFQVYILRHQMDRVRGR